MLHLIAPRATDARRIADRLAPVVATRPALSIGDTLTELETATGIVILASRGVAWRAFTALLAVRQFDPWVPVVVVVPPPDAREGASDREAFVRAGADAVWTDARVHTTPPEGLLRRVRRAPLQRLATIARHADHLVRPVRRAMVRGLLAERPPTTVRDLAASVGLHRTTLWRHWMRNDLPAIAPGACLDLLLLVHAAAARQGGGRWADAAAALGVLPSSLARVGRRVLPGGLQPLGDGPRGVVCETFRQRVFGTTPVDWTALHAARIASPAAGAPPSAMSAPGEPRGGPAADGGAPGPAVGEL